MLNLALLSIEFIVEVWICCFGVFYGLDPGKSPSNQNLGDVLFLFQAF